MTYIVSDGVLNSTQSSPVLSRRMAINVSCSTTSDVRPETYPALTTVLFTFTLHMHAHYLLLSFRFFCIFIRRTEQYTSYMYVENLGILTQNWL